MSAITLKDLAPNPKNPRTITEEKLAALKRALDEFGDLGGFVFNRRTKRLVGGHQRAKSLPQDSEVVVTRRFKKPTRLGTVAEGYVDVNGEAFKYREVDWNEIREKAANIAANKGAGEWDKALLGEWFRDLEFAIDLDLTLFDESEREALLAEPETQVVPTPEDDEVPKAPKKPKTVLGDVYELGSHRLMCGDATEPETIARLLDSDTPDTVFTDPPYGVDVVKRGKGAIGWSNKAKRADYRDVIGDDEPFEPGLILSEFEDAKIVLWGANYYSSRLPDSGRWIVWDKDRGEGTKFSDCELAWTNQKGVAIKKFKVTWDGMRREGETGVPRVHPTQKPVLLCEKILEDLEAKIVVDLYGGSGSTLIACEKLGLKCRMMELDPAYCDVIVERWESFTGKKAHRIAKRARSR